MINENQGEWGEYRRLILQELQRLHDGITEVKGQITMLHASDLAAMKSRIAVIETEVKLKSGIWGFIAGAIPAMAAAIYMVLRK